MELLLFGHPKSQETRKAKRFFSERNVAFHDRDLRKKPPSPGELRRWVEPLGVDAVLDTESRSYREQGLQYLGADPDDWIQRMVAEPLLIRLPLVRYGTLLAVGDDADGWDAIVRAVREG